MKPVTQPLSLQAGLWRMIAALMPEACVSLRTRIIDTVAGQDNLTYVPVNVTKKQARLVATALDIIQGYAAP